MITCRRRIYVASSWRNEGYPAVVEVLRAAGHEVFDFRNPRPGDRGFHWSEIDPGWRAWRPEEFRHALTHPIAERGFASDWGGMQWADTCVLCLPCNRSAHLEAGWFIGAGKPVYILLADAEPELMYKLATGICTSLAELLDALTVVFDPTRAGKG